MLNSRNWICKACFCRSSATRMFSSWTACCIFASILLSFFAARLVPPFPFAGRRNIASCAEFVSRDVRSVPDYARYAIRAVSNILGMDRSEEKSCTRGKLAIRAVRLGPTSRPGADRGAEPFWSHSFARISVRSGPRCCLMGPSSRRDQNRDPRTRPSRGRSRCVATTPTFAPIATSCYPAHVGSLRGIPRVCAQASRPRLVSNTTDRWRFDQGIPGQWKPPLNVENVDEHQNWVMT